MRDTLELQFGLKYCDPTVWRSMQRGYTRKRKLPATIGGMEHMRYPNLLHRDFHSDRPGRKIITDVTYIKYHAKNTVSSCFPV